MPIRHKEVGKVNKNKEYGSRKKGNTVLSLSSLAWMPGSPDDITRMDIIHNKEVLLCVSIITFLQ
jgi:hypothetical protein